MSKLSSSGRKELKSVKALSKSAQKYSRKISRKSKKVLNRLQGVLDNFAREQKKVKKGR